MLMSAKENEIKVNNQSINRTIKVSGLTCMLFHQESCDSLYKHKTNPLLLLCMCVYTVTEMMIRLNIQSAPFIQPIPGLMVPGCNKVLC